MLYLCKNFLHIKDMKLKVKYLVVLGLIMAMAVHPLKAEPVDTTTAKLAAYNFFRSISEENSRSSAEPVIVYKAQGTRQSGNLRLECDYYYIINIGQEGFVIVAADSRVTPILAYSTSSTFKGQQLPPNMAFLLGEYQEQMDEIDRQQIAESASVLAKWEELRHPVRNHQTRDIVVGPLITSKWSQELYYDAQCPMDENSASGHAVAGCTAVAMGQIMRYWRHPEHGVGSNSYESNYSYLGNGYGDYGTLSVNFENAYYDYDNMPDSLTSNSTPAEVNAVATLLYHCGVSVNTAYGIYNSSATFSNVDDALWHTFNYEPPMHAYRSVYSQSDWIEMMKRELNHLRPIFYTGAGSLSIHAFVCDGYDDEGYFHMNWGWGGNADGYFLLSNLNPDLYTFNTSQTAIIHVEAEQRVMTASEEELSFFVEGHALSEIQRFDVQTDNVDSTIHVSVSGNYGISPDSLTFVTQFTLPNTGGAVYVRYFPTTLEAHSDMGNVFLVAGGNRVTVRLVGANYFPECASPLDFTAVQGDIDTDTNQVLLTWQPPYPDILDLTWDTMPQSAIGDEVAYTIMPIHRFSITDLLPYHKHRLTHIAFIADSLVSEYRLLVYTAGRISENGRVIDPGTLIHEQQVDLSSLTMGAWNTVALDSPIVIDGSRELWYGLSVSAPANTQTVMTGGTEGEQFKGDIFGHVVDETVAWSQYNRNFVMKAVVDNPFVQYEVYRDGNPLAVPVEGLEYADYPPVYAHYLYEVRALWNDQCSQGISQMVNFRAPCHVVNETDVISACESYIWRDGVTYSESGVYTYEFYNEDECWQVDTLRLTINHSNSYTDTVEACDNYRWIDGVLYTESIVGPEVVLSTVHGCDSIVTLNLTINHSSSAIDEVVSSTPYTWIDGNTYTESTNDPVVILTNAVGCDSVVNLHLVITVGVGNHAMEELLVYPNPNNGFIKIQLPSDMIESVLEVRLYDMYGKLLQCQNVQADNLTMDLSRYAQGLYLIQLYQQNQLVGTAKISKNN